VQTLNPDPILDAGLAVDHIGIAVRSIDEAKTFYTGILGLPFTGVEDLDTMGVRVAMFSVGGTRIELIEPLRDDSPISRFLETRGQGIHHICFAVEKIGPALEKLRARGCPLIDEKPRGGAHGSLVAFLHPGAASGVLIELKEAGGNRATTE
jgi:methylmalonyl-CoA/ethylmalonyl-CoA epimerase